MVKYESNCNGCPDCIGCGRSHKKVAVVYCDICNHEIQDDVYNLDGQHVCEDCLKETFYLCEAGEIDQ